MARNAAQLSFALLLKTPYELFMANAVILDGTIKLRADAWQAVLASSEFHAFQALDDAVAKMGGGRLIEGVAGHGTLYTNNPFLSDAFRATLHHNVGAHIGAALRVAGTAPAAPRRISQADAAMAAIEKIATPLTTAQLVTLVPQFGGTVGGENPEINLSSSLSRDARLESVRVEGKAMWWLTGRTLPKNEPEPLDYDDLLGSGSSVPSDREGGEQDEPTTT